MKKSKYESLKKSINFLKAERRDMYRKLERLVGQADTLDTWLRQIVRVNGLRWPDISDMVSGIVPDATPFAPTPPYEHATKDKDPRIGTVAAETHAYQNGYMDGAKVRELIQKACGSVGPVTWLPDGSGCFIGNFPLPKDHWLYEKDADGFQPEMPEHLKWGKKHDNENIRHSLNAALKVAIRGATNGGKDEHLDPDALVMNFFNALFGPSETTVCHPTDTATEPSPG